MKSTEELLGDFIETCDLRNHDLRLNESNVRGIATNKSFIKTKANLQGVNLRGYKLVPPGHFAYVPDTSRRGNKMSLAFNNTEGTYLVSSISIVFKIIDEELLLSEYLFMYFNRPEFDRYARMNSWGSARETFSWGDMCSIPFCIPPMEIQKKAVNIFSSTQLNQFHYSHGLDDLKLACEALIERMRISHEAQPIGPMIHAQSLRNTRNLPASSVRGIATSKEFIPTKANLAGVKLDKYKVVEPRQFAYVADTSRRANRISLAQNTTPVPLLVSAISTVFATAEDKLLPEYLMLWLSRPEFDRYARFHSWGSARETFDWEDMCRVRIPIPDLDTQIAVVGLYKAFLLRSKINDRLQEQIKRICPVLIKWSIEETIRLENSNA